MILLSDYLHIIDTPMDLRTVREELIGGNYQSKSDFLKDVRMIFTNSRLYNTNHRSRVSLSMESFPCFLWYKTNYEQNTFSYIYINEFNAATSFYSSSFFLHALSILYIFIFTNEFMLEIIWTQMHKYRNIFATFSLPS